MKARDSINAAFQVSMAAQSEVHKRWISLSYRLVAVAPNPIVMSVQNLGMLDLVLREIEIARQTDYAEDNFGDTFQILLSELWIGSAYEIFRILKEKDTDNSGAKELHDDLKLVRIPVEKFEIANDKKLKEPIGLTTKGSVGIPERNMTYDKRDPLRNFIVPRYLSENGSVEWQVIDIERDQSVRLERLALANRILNLGRQ